MRLFLAIEPPPKVKKHIFEQLEVLYEEYKQFSWTPPENYHITIHFIGESEDAKYIIKKVETALYDAPSFYLFSQSAELFIQKKITLYISFQREKKLEGVADSIFDIFVPGTKLKFVPHLTVGRYKIPSKQQYLLLKKKMFNLPLDVEFEVRKVVLFDSIVTGKYPHYKKIHEFDFLQNK